MGQNEDALPSVRGTDFLRREETCRHAVAHAFQVANDVLEAKRYVACDVLEEDRDRLDFGDDSSDVGPQMPLVLLASTSACQREGLAGVASSDEIHSAAPRAAVEGREIVPDRCRIQGRFFHPRHEDGRRVGFPLDVAHSSASPSQGESDAKVEAADAGAEGEDAEVVGGT